MYHGQMWINLRKKFGAFPLASNNDFTFLNYFSDPQCIFYNIVVQRTLTLNFMFYTEKMFFTSWSFLAMRGKIHTILGEGMVKSEIEPYQINQNQF